MKGLMIFSFGEDLMTDFGSSGMRISEQKRISFSCLVSRAQPGIAHDRVFLIVPGYRIKIVCEETRGFISFPRGHFSKGFADNVWEVIHWLLG